MTESEKINGWTFEETVKTATNLMEVEQSMFKWDVLRHLRDFAEMYKEEVQRYRALGTVEELKVAKEKQIAKKPRSVTSVEDSMYVKCPTCKLTTVLYHGCIMDYCKNCGQKLDWSDEE